MQDEATGTERARATRHWDQTSFPDGRTGIIVAYRDGVVLRCFKIFISYKVKEVTVLIVGAIYIYIYIYIIHTYVHTYIHHVYYVYLRQAEW